jgi:hypothetical protein
VQALRRKFSRPAEKPQVTPYDAGETAGNVGVSRGART